MPTYWNKLILLTGMVSVWSTDLEGQSVTSKVLTKDVQPPLKETSLIQDSNGKKSQLSAPSDPVLLDKKTIIQLQSQLTSQVLPLTTGSDRGGEVRLLNLNPHINAWHLINIFWPHKKYDEWFHLELFRPKTQRIYLDKNYPFGIVIKENGQDYQCDLWSPGGANIKLAGYRKKPYTALCEGRIYLRQRIEGYRTTKEWVVEFLRDNVWGGGAITELVKRTIFKDRYLIKTENLEKSKQSQTAVLGSPEPAKLDPQFINTLVEAKELGIPLESKVDEMLVIGAWYPVKNKRGVFVSVIEPKAIAPDILLSYPKHVNPLGPIESTALNYLISFDLSKFDVNFAIGTDHPRVGWSSRVLLENQDMSLPGPDGIDSIEPLSATGLIPPHISKKVVASFTGGFKRSHAAFRWGPLAKKNFGSHYGVMENGVLFSTPQEELATLLIHRDGLVELRTWTPEDNEILPHLKHIRQNGVPIIKFDQDQWKGVPGKYVSRWGAGNWSGSQEREFRTLRAAVCLREQKGQRFLIYGYFSSVTPSAIARIFQAYGCDYAMHLDMNALEHTYLAIYSTDEQGRNVPYQLVKGMKVLDERFKGVVPRFIGYPDNRDYFYLTPRD